MGASNKRFREVRNLSAIEAKRMQLQNQIDDSKCMEERRKFGQFATPFELAREIVDYGLALLNDNEISFLEPAFGTGSFYSALLSEIPQFAKDIKSAVGIELDDQYYSAAHELWGDSNINLVNTDFTAAKGGIVNLLISNPPYVRHHYIGKEQKLKLAELIKNEIGLSIFGLAGLYCYFILLAHKWLAPDAICGWLIPSEFMDVNYGSILKQYLLDNVHLLRIHRYDPEECKFDDALVSSCVVWFKNELVLDNYDIEFSYGGTHENSKVSRRIDKNSLKKCRKWTLFPEKETINILYEKIDIATLGDYFNITRGLATGDNDFFILSKEKIKALGLDMTFFTPILPSPRYLKSNEIFCDSKGYPQLDPQYFLLNCTLPEDELKVNYPSIWHYLSSGKEITAQKYLCKNRKVWYFQESRSVTPFLCSYMGRGKGNYSAPFRFILNHTNAIATNSYLMLYPKAFLKEAISQSPDILHKVWEVLTNITAGDLECEGRVYGGGLKKIEPKELSNVKCSYLAELL